MLTPSVVRHAYGGVYSSFKPAEVSEDDIAFLREQSEMERLFEDLPLLEAWEQAYVEEGRVTRAFLYNVLWSPERLDVRSCCCRDGAEVVLGQCRCCHRPRQSVVGYV